MTLDEAKAVAKKLDQLGLLAGSLMTDDELAPVVEALTDSPTGASEQLKDVVCAVTHKIISAGAGLSWEETYTLVLDAVEPVVAGLLNNIRDWLAGYDLICHDPRCPLNDVAKGVVKGYFYMSPINARRLVGKEP